MSREPRKGWAEMKGNLIRIVEFQKAVQKRVDQGIDRLSRNAIAQEERRYELLYGKTLSEKEVIEIKKGVVMRFAFLLLIPLILLLLTLMNRGMS